MTPTKREAALRLADDMDTPISVWADHVAHLLRELAAEPVQEPVCWGWRVPDGRITMIFSERKDNPDVEVVALYAAPQQRKPLSDEQIDAVTRELWGQLLGSMMMAHRAFARAVERAHGIGEAP